MDFVKMHGIGNDFIVVKGPYVPEPEDVRRWCERRTGVGADGVLVAEPISPDLVSMRYWNADGERQRCVGTACVVLRDLHSMTVGSRRTSLWCSRSLEIIQSR